MRAWVEVDLAALVRNARALSDRARVPLVPMVKADAYGLGAVPVVTALESLDPWGYGVALLAEGVELRKAGVRRPIIVFTPLLAAELDGAAAADVIPALGASDTIAAWGPSGRPWHLSLDTGMHRTGAPWDAVDALRAQLIAYPPDGAFTHFHSADLYDHSMAAQLDRFRTAIARLPARPRLVHTENSAAIERLTGPSCWDLVRPGVFLYGVGATAEPVATLRATVVDLRTIGAGESVSYGATWRARSPRRIATLGVGYADGYRRAFSNVGRVVINDREAPVVGAVTMDMTMIDVTDVPCVLGDVATLLGRAGDRVLDAVTVADDAGVSPYELLVGLKLRATRIYLGTSPADRGTHDAT